MDKPKYTIKNFTKDNIYLLRGMFPLNVSGNSILTSGYQSNEYYGSSDIASMGTMNGSRGYAMFSIEGLDSSEYYMLSINGTYIHLLPKNVLGSYEEYGQIHSFTNSLNCDIYNTENNTILYTSQKYLGLGYFLEADSVSQTSIDTGGVDLGLKGIGTATADKKIYNFESGSAGSLGEEYDVTSLSGGTAITAFSDYSGTVAGTVLVTAGSHGLTTGDEVSIRNTTNYNGDFTITKVGADTFYITDTWVSDDATGNVSPDVINFATATKTLHTGDQFTAFIDNKFDFGVGTASRNEHFKGQESTTTWNRQIKFFSDSYFIGNGNYLSKLNSNEETWDADYKQLPSKHQFKCMGINNDELLVGADDLKNNGKLLLWDGWKTNWISNITISDVPVSIIAYKTGWLVFTEKGKLYFTDGYDKQLLSVIPGFEKHGSSFGSRYFNNMKFWDDKIFIAVSGDSQKMKGRPGVDVYDIKKDVWSYLAIDSEYYGKSMNSNIYAFADGWDDKYLYYGTDDSFGRIYRGNGNYSEAILKIVLPEKDKINQIELNLDREDDYQSFISDLSGSTDISVSVSDGRGIPYYTTNVYTPTTTTLDADDTYTDILKVGNEIEITGGSKAVGEQTFITSIADGGTNAEKWTISPALTEAPVTGIEVGVYNFKKCDEVRTVGFDDFNTNLRFTVPDFYGNTLWLHIRMVSTRVDINAINIY